MKAIAISLLPNFGRQELGMALKWLGQPWRWAGREESQKLEKELATYLKVKQAVVTESGRSGFNWLLKALGIGNGDEVAIQALTCSVVPGAIMQAGAKPIYVDVDESLNMDGGALKKAISQKTKAVVVQHSFGKAAKVDEIAKICRERKIILIEDLAHGLGNEYQGRKLGSWGEAAFLSFGRDKVISGVWGGAVVSNNQKLVEKVRGLAEKAPVRDWRWIKKQLLYVPLTFLVLATYKSAGLGKVMHLILRRTGLLSEPISREEKRGKAVVYNQGLPNPMAALVRMQLRKMDKFIEHRKKLAKIYSRELGEKYDQDCSYLRYKILVNQADELRQKAAGESIFLGDWYDQVVAPKKVNPADFGYEEGSCPRAEKISKMIVNLPTNPNMSKAEAGEVAKRVLKWKSEK